MTNGNLRDKAIKRLSASENSVLAYMAVACDFIDLDEVEDALDEKCVNLQEHREEIIALIESCIRKVTLPENHMMIGITDGELTQFCIIDQGQR